MNQKALLKAIEIITEWGMEQEREKKDYAERHSVSCERWEKLYKEVDAENKKLKKQKDEEQKNNGKLYD